MESVVSNAEHRAIVLGHTDDERVITLDTHNDISTANFTADRNYTMALSTQVNLPNMEAGGFDVSWMVVFVGQGDLTPERYGDAHRQALAKFEAVHRLT